MKKLIVLILISFSFFAKSAVKNFTSFLADRNSITIDFKTGSDNLDHRDYQKNVSVVIKINGKADLVLENVNKGENWPNNSVRRTVADLPDNIIVQDIYSIAVARGNAKGMWNNVDGAGADNWNLDRLTINANIMENGVSKKYLLADLKSNRPPLYRFVYELRRNPCSNCGYTYTHIFKHEYVSTDPSAITTTPMLAKLTFTIGTGGDNLEGGNNNVDIKIRMKDSPTVYVVRNINASRKWDNFTEKTRTMDITNSLNMNLENIKEIEIRHTGGGGFAADNWDVDKIFISISKDGVTKNLVDKVGAPIQRFTGDNRALIVRF
jgi:hypothetical protein